MAIENNRWGIIYNPKAGSRKTQKRWNKIREYMEERGVLFDYLQSEGYGSVERLARMLANNGYRTIVVVGGDGAINDAVNGIMTSSVERKDEIAFGIIPNGSGNGFARHLDISTRMNRAIEMLNSSEVINVDYGMVNDQPFFSTCGVGFDAVVAEKFSDTNRGLKGYVQTIFKDLFQ